MMASRLAYALLLLLTAASPAAARPDDLAGWQGARWGMNVADLDRAVAGLERLAKPFVYSGAEASRSAETELGGVPLLVLFQTGTGSGRLQQVLLQTRRYASPNDHQAIVTALRALYGPPDAVCAQSKDADGRPLLVEQVWRFPSTVVHATLMDFTTAELHERPREREYWRGLPRRILIRFHPPERADLWGRCGR